MMKFESFQATKTDCDDIGKAINSDMGVEYPIPGFLYVGTLYIEKVVKEHWPDAGGDYHLVIERDEWVSSNLEMLERHLFDFAISSGHEMDIDDLTREYAHWNKAQGLSLGSADEHFHDETLTEEQRAWVRDFSARWEEAERRERGKSCRHRDSGRGVCIDCGAAL